MWSPRRRGLVPLLHFQGPHCRFAKTRLSSRLILQAQIHESRRRAAATTPAKREKLVELFGTPWKPVGAGRFATSSGRLRAPPPASFTGETTVVLPVPCSFRSERRPPPYIFTRWKEGRSRCCFYSAAPSSIPRKTGGCKSSAFRGTRNVFTGCRSQNGRR